MIYRCQSYVLTIFDRFWAVWSLPEEKSCQELLQIKKTKLKTYLKSSYCLLRFTQVLSLGMICDISSKITSVDNMYGVLDCFDVFQIPDSSLPERKKLAKNSLKR